MIRGDVVLTDPRLTGFEYGMLHDLRVALSARTGGRLVDAPFRPLPRLVARYSHPATRYAPLGRLLRALSHSQVTGLSGDTLWLALMGPESFPFWHQTGWEAGFDRVVLYLFDSFEAQFPLVRRLLASGRVTTAVTSFPAAVPLLEADTGRRWHAALQGVAPERFYPLPPGVEPAIPLSCYGRRWPAAHQEAAREFAQEKGLHYDYTVAAGLPPGSDPTENYDIFAWHLRQSWFTFCWPVELTNPRRVLGFSPITCRWFEAAASGSVVIGQPPTDPAFEATFGPGFVERLDPHAPSDVMRAHLAGLWERRRELRAARLDLARRRGAEWTWAARADQLVQTLERIEP